MPARPVALVTGASSGIGKELARRFAAGGHDLILTARRDDELRRTADETAKAHGVACHVLAADLSDPAAPQRLFDEATARGLVVDVLVNNAGFGVYGPLAENDPAKLLAMLRVNVVALTHLTRLFLPGMIDRRRGRVLNLASTAAFQPGPLMAGYYATKAFVLSLSEALSEEVKGTGVTVTCLCPGPTRTEFAEAAEVEDLSIFQGAGVMAVGPVADLGYRATMRGRRTAVAGWLNRLAVTASPFVPRAILLPLVKRMQAKKSG